MTLQRQAGFWAIALVVFIALLWLLNDILLPFLAGIVLAYFLDPVADALERAGMRRWVASLFILLCSILVFTAVLVLLVPILADQIANFVPKIPSYVSALTRLFNDLAPQWVKEFLTRSGTDVTASASDIAGRAAGWLGTIVASLWTGGLALVNVLSLLTITPIVAYYMLSDWDRMVAKVDDWLPREHQPAVRQIARDIDAAMAGFIRGQGTVCIVLGIFYAIALSFAGLNFGLLIGIAAGLLSFIPFIGALIGGIAAVGTGLVQFWPDWVHILIVAAIFAAGQFLEGNFLSPKLVGHRVGLHPVWLIFALLAFGYLFGFVGLLLAVPLAAAVGVLVRFGLNQYLKSPYYLGPTPQKSRRHK